VARPTISTGQLRLRCSAGTPEWVIAANPYIDTIYGRTGERWKSGAYGTGWGDRHVTPSWVLQSNLRLLYRNHRQIRGLQIFRAGKFL